MPLAQLLYAQVIKTTRRRRLGGVTHRVVFGTIETVHEVLRPLGWHINTSLVERVNLSLRQHVAAIGRRTSTLCKGEAGLRQPLAEPISTHGRGSAKLWGPCTPAMGAGLTNHIWSLKEVLLFRVPPWPQPQTV
jgi:hypothetical protein